MLRVTLTEDFILRLCRRNLNTAILLTPRTRIYPCHGLDMDRAYDRYDH